jgi:hypothetical protein
MKKRPEFMHVRPVNVDVGRGPELARIPFRRDGRKRELKPDGEKVYARNAEGAFWKRRIADGVVEMFTPAKPAKKPKD